MLMSHELMITELTIKEILIGTMLMIYCVLIKIVKPYDKKKHDIFNNLDMFANAILFINIYQSHLWNS